MEEEEPRNRSVSGICKIMVYTNTRHTCFVHCGLPVRGVPTTLQQRGPEVRGPDEAGCQK